MLRQFTAFSLLLLFISFPIKAQSIECLNLVEGEEVELRLRAEGDFENCFRIEGYDSHDTVAFFLLGHNDIEQYLSVYNANAPEEGPIASSDDNAPQMHSVISPMSESGVVFTVSSKDQWRSDKVIYVSYIEGPDELFVYIGIKPY